MCIGDKYSYNMGKLFESPVEGAEKFYLYNATVVKKGLQSDLQRMTLDNPEKHKLESLLDYVNILVGHFAGKNPLKADKIKSLQYALSNLWVSIGDAE